MGFPTLVGDRLGCPSTQRAGGEGTMRTSIVAFIVAGICTAAVADNGSKREEDMLGQMRAEQRALAKQAAGGVTAADVGDPDSFGRNVQFLGVAQTGLV